MATAKKLPSGSWRCQVFSHFEEQIQKDGTVTSKETVKASDSTGTTATKTTTLDAKGNVTTAAEAVVSAKAVTEASASTRGGGNGSETTVQARKVRSVVGTGPQYWDNLCNQHRACMVGSSFTFAPSTNNFSATIVLKIDEVKVLKTTNGAFTPGDK